MSFRPNFSISSLLNHGQPGGATSTPALSQQASGHVTTGPMYVAGAQPMNPQLSQPLLPAGCGVLQEAIQKYIPQLSDEDRAAFISAPDIMERLQDLQSNHKSALPSSLTTRVERVLQCIKHFMGSLSIFIQQHPETSALVVGGVNCILTVGSTPAS